MTCIELRGGNGRPLFVFPGVGGDVAELQPLAEALETRRPVVGVEPFEPHGARDQPPSVEAVARQALSLVQERQPAGPYHLLGYSFGGFVALEVSQALRSEGQEVPFLGLVDVVYDRRYWPLRLFAWSIARRISRHLRGFVTEPSARSWRDVSARMRRWSDEIAAHASRRSSAEPEDPASNAVDHAVMARWRPRAVNGRVLLFAGGEQDDVACDLAALWRPWIRELEVRRVPGSRLGLVREPETVVSVARAVDRALLDAEASPLRVLLATTFDWESAWRLAIELKNVGFLVDAVAPPTSKLQNSSSVETTFRLDRLRPLGSLRTAVVESRADLVIPFDDRTRQALHSIHDHADASTPAGAGLRERIRRSLGPSTTYSRIYSRAYVMGVAAGCGVRCPPTVATTSLADVLAFVDEHGAAVLKTDGSWGGREIAVVRSRAEATRAWRRLSRPPGVARIAKRWLVDRDPWPLRARLARQRPSLSIQAYAEGRPANVAVACLDGELLGAVQAEVVRSNGEFGPSTVIRVVDHPEMLGAAKALVAELGLTGLCGLDFIVDPETGDARMVELNPRATPTAHLLSVDGVDILTSLRRALGRAWPPPRTCTYPDGLVALHPLELQRDPTSPFLTTAFHDVPVERADLTSVEDAALDSGAATAS